MMWRTTELALDERSVKGVPDAPPAADLATQVLLGVPVCRPMSEVAAELAASDPGHGYTLVELGATFSPAEGERIRQAWLMVRLSSSSSDGGQGSAAGAGVPASGSPIAWSMTTGGEFYGLDPYIVQQGIVIDAPIDTPDADPQPGLWRPCRNLPPDKTMPRPTIQPCQRASQNQQRTQYEQRNRAAGKMYRPPQSRGDTLLRHQNACPSDT